MPAQCAACSAALPEAARFCLSCGAPVGGAGGGEEWAGGVPPPPAPASKMSPLVIVLIIGGVVFGGIFVIAIIAAIAIPNLLAAKLSANETAAIATLRNLTSCQAQIQTSGKIDGDEDGIGEYGTFAELTGTVGVRKGKGGDERGSRVNPPILSPSLANVDASGVVVKSGYCFILYLPDASGRGWVHETAPGGLSGPVGVDAAEERWCAFAWPVARGNTGNRCFFVNQAGDIFQSPNERARHSGPGAAPPPDCAGQHGQAGKDGDVWKICN